MLLQWHRMLFKGSNRIPSGQYRTHPEAMQIVSEGAKGRVIHFEAPPSKNISDEMTKFISWYNSSSSSESILGRAALAHVYFESIHPFEDGNGRIGRVLVEKALSQGVGHPTLIAVSKFIEKHKKEYYAELGRCNQTLDAQHWVEFFAKVILQAQEDSLRILHFLIKKSKMLTSLSGRLNHRQEKALLRMFAEGPDGFIGGLSAKKYVAITKATRATATRDLNDLTKKGALKKTGERRYTRYWLNLD
jgi:Fic family protein